MTADFMFRIAGAVLTSALTSILGLAFVDSLRPERGPNVLGWFVGVLWFAVMVVAGGLVLWADSGA